VVGCWQNDNETSGFIEAGEFRD